MAGSSKNKGALSERKGVTPPGSVSSSSAENIRVKRKQFPSVEELIAGISAGDKGLLSRGITLIESKAKKHQEEAKKLIHACLPKANNAVRIGITGVPGVGKSTFIEQLGKILIAAGKKVAVLAVDPSSTLSKGSILGDKTRMEELVKEESAFIRPSASGDSLGGVARKTREAIILCEAAGFNVILIETVGVGQSETAVHSMTDFFLLLKLAGAGDELQGIKRGIIELADAIVINKADGENQKAARLAKTEFNRALHLYPSRDDGWRPRTVLTSALENEGIREVWDMIEEYLELSRSSGSLQQKRKEQNKYWLEQTIEDRLKSGFYQNPKVKEQLKLIKKELDEDRTTPFEAADRLLSI